MKPILYPISRLVYQSVEMCVQSFSDSATSTVKTKFGILMDLSWVQNMSQLLETKIQEVQMVWANMKWNITSSTSEWEIRQYMPLISVLNKRVFNKVV